MKLIDIIKGVSAVESANKILPMDDNAPKIGPKTKLAGIFAVIAAVATAISHFLGG